MPDDDLPSTTTPARTWRWFGWFRPQPRARGDDYEPFSVRVTLPLALSVISTIASIMAANGQLALADRAHITGPMRYSVPVIFDLFAVVLVLLGYRQGRRMRSPYPLWALGAAVGWFSAYLNLLDQQYLMAGIIFASASIASILSWFVKYRLDLTAYLVKMGRVPPQRPRFGRLVLVSPRLTFHAWRVSHRRRIVDVDTAVRLAETWMVIYDDMIASKHLRKIAVRTAWRAIDPSPPILPSEVDVSRVRATSRPTDRPPVERSVSTQQPARPRKPTTDRPRRPNRPTQHSRSAIDNAVEVRRYYGAGRPRNARQLRVDLGWSHDRARSAYAAYVAGADLEALVEAPN